MRKNLQEQIFENSNRKENFVESNLQGKEEKHPCANLNKRSYPYRYRYPDIYNFRNIKVSCTRESVVDLFISFLPSLPSTLPFISNRTQRIRLINRREFTSNDFTRNNVNNVLDFTVLQTKHPLSIVIRSM